jgi:monoamine oxidase
MARGELSGTRVVVAGAGLAGLAAARDLEAEGADVHVVEARDRVGGRVVTIRHGFARGQHAEGGADLIEGEQDHVRELTRSLGLSTVQILRNGWGFYGCDRSGRRRLHSQPRTFQEAAKRLNREIAEFCLAEERWDSPISERLARQSVADWIGNGKRDPLLAAGLRGLRGFFLADPEELSLLVLVEQFASGDTPGLGAMFRIRDGNDRLPQAMARRLRRPVALETIIRRVSQSETGVRVTVEADVGQRELTADYCVIALPATAARDVRFEPALPDDQHRAIAALKYGRATRLLLQFASRFWKKPRRATAFGTDLPLGALWDGNEQQKGREGILTFLAGGRASAELQCALDEGGPEGVAQSLSWIGKPSPLVASTLLVWEDEPWSRGGYAYFDPQFDPKLRNWLSRPAGRIVFAGEHTSRRWQGYMNGAIESGKRAAAEIRAIQCLTRG